jgi:WD40 repeat protein
LAFASDSSILLIGSDNQRTLALNIDIDRPALSRDSNARWLNGEPEPRQIWDAMTLHANVYPDVKTLALMTVESDGDEISNEVVLIRFEDLTSLSQSREPTVIRFPATAMAFSHDAQTLATGTYDGKIFLWDPSTGQERARLWGHFAAVQRLGFSSDSEILASLDSEGQLLLWGASKEVPLDMSCGLPESDNVTAAEPRTNSRSLSGTASPEFQLKPVPATEPPQLPLVPVAATEPPRAVASPPTYGTVPIKAAPKPPCEPPSSPDTRPRP